MMKLSIYIALFLLVISCKKEKEQEPLKFQSRITMFEFKYHDPAPFLALKLYGRTENLPDPISGGTWTRYEEIWSDIHNSVSPGGTQSFPTSEGIPPVDGIRSGPYHGRYELKLYDEDLLSPYKLFLFYSLDKLETSPSEVITMVDGTDTLFLHVEYDF